MILAPRNLTGYHSHRHFGRCALLMPIKPLYVIAAAFVLIAACYAYATPIFESPDENNHAAFMDYVASTGQIPVQVVGVETRWAQEGSQPPLYYLITGLLTSWTDRSDFDHYLQSNPHAIIGDPSAEGNQNAMLHDDPYPPRLSGTALAVFIGRAFSVLCGAVTVIAVYQCGRVIAPDTPSVALIAAGLTAFNPQFVFIAASVNNDNLVTALNSLVLWQMLVLLRDGFSTRRSLLIAVLIALASLTKLSGLVLIPVVALAGLYVAYRRRDLRGLIVLGAAMAGLWMLIAGWWYVRNLTLYGDFTGMQRMLDIFGRRPAPPLLDLIRKEFEGLRISYWGLFGLFNVFTSHAFYVIMDLLSLVGVVGLAVAAFRMPRARLVRTLFLALALTLGGASLISWTMQTAASQGRLLFPFIAAISCLLALGLTQFRVPALAVDAPLALFALAVPFITIMPTYTPPAPLTELPASAQPIYAQFADMALVGYEITPQRYGPGDTIPVTLYWKPLRQSSVDYSMFLRLLSPNDDILAVLPTYPGYGRLRTSTWTPGAIYTDSYRLHIAKNLSGQFGLRVYVGWWKFPENYPLDPVSENGERIAQVIFPVGGFVNPDDPAPALEQPITPVDFGGVVSLVGYELTDRDLTLLWEATGQMNEDYTAFVYALNDAGAVIAQGDAPPVLPTRFWRPGERFESRHTITYVPDAEPGTYTLYVGWYSTIRPMRLSAAYPDNAYPLTTITLPAR